MNVNEIRIILRQGHAEISGTAWHESDDPNGDRVLIGMDGEVVLVPQGNIAAIIMAADVAGEHFRRLPR